MRPVAWGIFSTANIAVERVIPAMQQGALCRIAGIASRDIERAQQAAERLGIPKAFGSYEELLSDPEIEAVYNPLPNYLHLEWTAKAAEAGKHVLCEKPLTLNAAEAEELVRVRDRTGVLIEEAFMLRNHAQWKNVKEMVQGGKIGKLRVIQGCLTSIFTDPRDIRNIPEVGGGSIYDAGCYPIAISRFLFESEPTRVMTLIERDPESNIDRLVSAILQFPQGHSSFCASLQVSRFQRVQLLGTDGWIGIETPFVVTPECRCRIEIGEGRPLGPVPVSSLTMDPVNQFTLQGDRFSRLVRSGDRSEWPLEDAVANMRVIDALFRSEQTGMWEAVAA